MEEAFAAEIKRLLEGSAWSSVSSTTDPLVGRKKTEFQEKEIEVFTSREEKTTGAADALAEGFGRDIKAIAYKCHKGKKPDAPNQDSFSILVKAGEFALYCVYDGHGPQGHLVSEHVRQCLVKDFVRRVHEHKEPIKEAFEEAFRQTQSRLKELNNTKELDSSMSGTTCTMVYHDMIGKKLHIAHVGDSRAVLGKLKDQKLAEVEALTEDHKPNLPEEKRRIEESGGRVVFDGFYNHRVFAADGPYPGLNMSRALGDVVGHDKAGLSAIPDYKEIDLGRLKEVDGFDAVLLLCTDGVWEFVENDEAVNTLLDNRAVPSDLYANLHELTKTSYRKWMQDSDNEISDDITGIAVVL